ncbi:amino acid ABC transporter substrate-binding protein [Cucumibacter marinus]|uniref:amino acid ABC transporter substrate-binding protein n=1 Tax=Cucumibacter marinus TaxID=1121252 RepID=UPI000406AA4E|nr:amino acid ABC transporter substrate-binding protein [Cucumibacter marinus]
MTLNFRQLAALILTGGPALLTSLPAAADTLGDVRERGRLVCGVSEGLRGFSEQAEDGSWVGFDVDFCKAVASVTLGDTNLVDYVPLTAAERFEALGQGQIDLLSRNSTWTLSRDLMLGLDFAGVSYYDGQGFLLPALYGVTNPLQLAGATVCVVSGTTSEQNARHFFEGAGMSLEISTFAERDDARAAYEAGECDAYTADRSALAAERSLLASPDDHILLRDVISKEPLGPVVRQDDPVWRDLVRWTLFALVTAEELDLSADDTETTSLLGESMTEAFRLDPGWYARLIGDVGTYAAIFERNLGTQSPLELGRGLNALWTQGGLLYAPPMQ